MGTRFRTLLAPIGVSTGDGRRFADGGITLADTPFSFEWVREREGGHDGAVAIGVVDQAKVLTVAKAIEGGWISEANAKGLDPAMSAVFGQGELFDAVDREEMPRLAEDVAEAMTLIGAGTLGPSVDLDSFEAKPVLEGTDEELTWDAVEAYYEEHGEEPPIEMLVTEGRVRAATLVTIPAFSETARPLELIAAEPVTAAEGEAIDVAQAREDVRVAALVASVSAPALPEIAQFAMPVLTGPTPITWDFKTGRVFGHIATWRTCHVGYPDTCITPPQAEGGYSWFNRFAVETADGGVIGAGRITLGGRHAALSLSASSAMAAYDLKTVAADVVAYEDEHGIVVAGVIRPGLTASDIGVLNRRKVSGDWREVGGSLALVEVLALSPGPRSQSEPGFPVAEVYSSRGRQVALTASFGPEDVPGQGPRFAGGLLDVDALAAALERRQAQRAANQMAAQAAEEARAGLADVIKIDSDRERAALAAVLGEE